MTWKKKSGREKSRKALYQFFSFGDKILIVSVDLVSVLDSDLFSEDHCPVET